METLRQRRPRLILEPEEYDALKRRVLERDRWRCQCCGSQMNLQVHHLARRGQLGSDVIENLITLCAVCHHLHHNLILGRRADSFHVG